MKKELTRSKGTTSYLDHPTRVNTVEKQQEEQPPKEIEVKHFIDSSNIQHTCPTIRTSRL